MERGATQEGVRRLWTSIPWNLYDTSNKNRYELNQSSKYFVIKYIKIFQYFVTDMTFNFSFTTKYV